MKKFFMILIIFCTFLVKNAIASEQVHVWGPEKGNYNVCPVEKVNDIVNMTDLQIKEKVLQSENVYNIVKGLKGKDVANAWRGELARGNYEIVSPLAEYRVGSGYGDGCLMPGLVVLTEKLKKFLKVLRVVVVMNNKAITIDIPVWDTISGVKVASCFNPLIDEEIVAGPTPPPIPTPTPTLPPTPPPTITPTPPPEKTPEITPTPEKPRSGGVLFENGQDVSSETVWDAAVNTLTIIIFSEPEKTPTCESTPTPEPTCPPDETPPPTPPTTDPTCLPTPPPAISDPQNPNQPLTPPDDMLNNNPPSDGSLIGSPVDPGLPPQNENIFTPPTDNQLVTVRKE